MSEITKDLPCICFQWEPLAYSGGTYGDSLTLTGITKHADRIVLSLVPDEGDPFEETILFSEYATIDAVATQILAVAEGCIIEGPETSFISSNVVYAGGGCSFEGDFASWDSTFLHSGGLVSDQNWNLVLRFTIPDKTDVRANVEFGPGGTSLVGKLPAPAADSGEGETRGQDCKLYWNANTHEDPTWVEVNLVRELTLDLERNEHDATTRASGDFEVVTAGLMKAPATFDMLWVTSNPSFQALLAAFLNNTLIEMAVMDGPMTTPGRTGLLAQMRVLKFGEGQPKDGNVTASVIIKPGLSTQVPQWYTVPEAA